MVGGGVEEVIEVGLIRLPQSISVTANGQVMRKREAVIDGNTGDVTQVSQYF